MPKTYFFCGIGGSGMLPLASLMRARGNNVAGSDRSRDQGKSPEKFEILKQQGITLYPQDGSGLSKLVDVLVVSSAIENTIPDVKAALELEIPIIKRGKLLAECFNQAQQKIAVAGTSGKSTVTGMIGTILAGMNLDPTIVNGGAIRNLDGAIPGLRTGRADLFVSEMDESDGSIAHYQPTIAVLNNIALDHKTMEELEQLFGDYLAAASEAVILNADHQRVMALTAKVKPKAKPISYSIASANADLCARDIKMNAEGMSFTLTTGKKSYPAHLTVTGEHNLSNALASLAAAQALKLDMQQAINALQEFRGIHRRLEIVGKINEITIIDDFGHNPDKIAATLKTLKAFPGRLIVMFQPHGFGPLKLMGKEIAETFVTYLQNGDILLMPEAYYAGGTVDRSVTAKHVIKQVQSNNIDAHWFSQRTEIPAYIKSIAAPGDRIIVMGARDDTLHYFAKDLLSLF